MNKFLAATAAIALTASMANADDCDGEFECILDEGGLQVAVTAAALALTGVDTFVMQGAFNQADLDGSINIDAGEGSVEFNSASEAASATATSTATIAGVSEGAADSAAIASAVSGSSFSTTVIGAYNDAAAAITTTADDDEVASINVAYNYGTLNGSVSITSEGEYGDFDGYYGRHGFDAGFEASDLNISTTVIGAYNMGSAGITYTDIPNNDDGGGIN